MPEITIKTKFYKFDQNNSGGHFIKDAARGIGPKLWIEATDVAHAIARAEQIGLYWDGVAAGQDCGCCGDRWSTPWKDEGEESVSPDPKYDFTWFDTVYVHRMDGTIEQIKKPVAVN